MTTTLGERLNSVPKSQIPCPGCKRRERLDVYDNAVQWQCGHTRPLPPRTSFYRYTTSRNRP